MDAVASGSQGGGEQSGLVEIAFGGLGRTDAHRLGSQLDVEGLRVGLGIDGHGFNSQLPAGPQHPQGDLAPVGDQNPLQHGL